MDRTLVVLLLLLLGGYWVVISGLSYETNSAPLPNEYFTRDEPTGEQVVKTSNSDDSLNRSDERTQDAKDRN